MPLGIHFIGKVVPSNHYSTTMLELPEIQYKSPDLNIECAATLRVEGSAVDVKCIVNRWDSDAKPHIHKIAYDLARAAINFVCFSTGLHFSIVFDELIDPDGEKTAFIIHHPDLASLCTSYRLDGTGTVKVLQLVLSNPQIFLALDDLITGTGHHHLLTVNSARAIEGLRHAMGGVNANRSDQWTLFRTNLNLSKDYLKLITDTSFSGRHGEGTYIPGRVTEEITKRAWVIMNRFLEFKKNGDQALPLAEFPLL